MHRYLFVKYIRHNNKGFNFHTSIEATYEINKLLRLWIETVTRWVRAVAPGLRALLTLCVALAWGAWCTCAYIKTCYEWLFQPRYVGFGDNWQRRHRALVGPEVWCLLYPIVVGKDRAVDLGDQGNSNGETDAYKIISLQAFIHPDVEDEARCLGFMSTFNGSSDFAFDSLPYGSALFLNFSRDYAK